MPVPVLASLCACVTPYHARYAVRPPAHTHTRAFAPVCLHTPHTHTQISVRVMSYYQFMNSKVLFKEVRHKPAGSTAMPVMVHISELYEM